MGFSNYDRTAHKIMANGVTTIEFNGEHPNYYRVYNLGNVPLYCSTMNIPTTKLFDFKVEPNSTMSFAEPHARDRIYVFNPNNVDVEILLTKWLGEFDPVYNALSNAAVNVFGSIETDGLINGFNAPLPSGSNNIGKVGLDTTTLQQILNTITQANSGGVDYTSILNILKSDLASIKNWNYYVENVSDMSDSISEQVYGTREKLDSLVAILTEIKESGGGFFFDGYKSGDLIMLQKFSDGGYHYLYKIPNVEYFTNLKIHSVSTLKDSDINTVKIGCLRQDGGYDVFDLLSMPTLDWIPTNEVYSDMVLYVHRNNSIQLDFKYSYKCCESIVYYDEFTSTKSLGTLTDKRISKFDVMNVTDGNGSYNGTLNFEMSVYGLTIPFKVTVSNGTGSQVISVEEIPPVMSITCDVTSIQNGRYSYTYREVDE